MPLAMSTAESGEWLVANLAEMERRQSAWLEVLAEFDQAQGWAIDGQFSCAEWLMWKGRMARATAYEKLLVAHELRRRPILQQAYALGRLSYSALRVIARMEDADPEVDQAMVELAEAGTVRDVGRVAGAYRRHAEQHRPPGEAMARRGVRVRPNLDGTSSVEITLSDLEVEEVMACLQAFLDSQTLQSQEDLEAARGARLWASLHMQTGQGQPARIRTSLHVQTGPRPGSRAAGPTRRPTPSWTWSAPAWPTSVTARRPATTVTWCTWSPRSKAWSQSTVR